jgi:hypothetical protein
LFANSNPKNVYGVASLGSISTVYFFNFQSWDMGARQKGESQWFMAAADELCLGLLAAWLTWLHVQVGLFIFDALLHASINLIINSADLLTIRNF